VDNGVKCRREPLCSHHAARVRVVHLCDTTMGIRRVFAKHAEGGPLQYALPNFLTAFKGEFRVRNLWMDTGVRAARAPR